MSEKIKDVQIKLKTLNIDEALVYLDSLENQQQAGIIKLKEQYTKKKKAFEIEVDRFNKMKRFELKAFQDGYTSIAGIDEVGRGPLAGPVVAASVILPQDIFIEKLNDSKKLSLKKREAIFEIIKEKALTYSIGIIDEKVIDEVNIINATRDAMVKAVQGLSIEPDLLLIDAERLDKLKTKQVSIIKGDSLSISIAAASIIAKVTRDRIMDDYHTKYPEYGFINHKGYGTKEHIEAIKKYGLCPIHRTSFTKNFVG